MTNHRRLRVVSPTNIPADTSGSTPAGEPPSTSPPPSQEFNAASTYLDPIPGIIPFGTITIFAGAPGVGKTAMLVDWIVRMRDGRTIWGHQTNPAVAYAYIAADRQWSSHQKWLDLAGFSDIPRYSIADDPTFNLNDLIGGVKALDLFKRSLDRANNGSPVEPGTLVIVDPIAPIFIAGNANVSRDVARSLLGMSRECQSRKITLVVTAHFGKQTADKTTRYTRPQDRIAGSGAFSGFSDTQIYLVDPDPPDYPHHVLGWNPRHSRPEDFACKRNDVGLFIPYDVLTEDRICAEVLECFPDNRQVTSGEMYELVHGQYGYGRTTVKSALRRLHMQGRIIRIGHGKATVYQRVKLH